MTTPIETDSARLGPLRGNGLHDGPAVQAVRRLAKALVLMGWIAAQGAETPLKLPPAEAMTRADAFSAWFAALLGEQYPQAGVKVISPLVLTAMAGGRSVITIHLDRFFSACTLQPDDRERCYQRVSSYLPNVMPGDDGSPITPDAIVALVRTKVYLEKASAAAPGDLNKQPVARHLVGPLWVLYAYDNSQGTGLLSASQYKALRLTSDQLDLLAVRNLQRLLGPLEVSGSPILNNGVQAISRGNPYESSRLLLYEQWEALAQTRKVPLLVSVPVQDVLVYTLAQHTGAAALRDMDLRIVKGASFPISPVVLRWTSTGWVEEPPQ